MSGFFCDVYVKLLFVVVVFCSQGVVCRFLVIIDI